MSHRLLLDQRLAHQDVFDRVATCELDFERHIPAGPDTPEAFVWRDGHETEVQLLEDQLIGVRYLWLHGPDELRWSETLVTKVPTWSVDFVVARCAAAESSDEWIHCLHLAAVLAVPGRFDPQLYAWFERGAHHPDPEVRHEAVFSMSYAAWTELVPLLTAVANQDLDGRVRGLAEMLLEPLSRKVR